MSDVRKQDNSGQGHFQSMTPPQQPPMGYPQPPLRLAPPQMMQSNQPVMYQQQPMMFQQPMVANSSRWSLISLSWISNSRRCISSSSISSLWCNLVVDSNKLSCSNHISLSLWYSCKRLWNQGSRYVCGDPVCRKNENQNAFVLTPSHFFSFFSYRPKCLMSTFCTSVQAGLTMSLLGESFLANCIFFQCDFACQRSRVQIALGMRSSGCLENSIMVGCCPICAISQSARAVIAWDKGGRLHPQRAVPQQPAMEYNLFAANSAALSFGGQVASVCTI